MSKIISIDEQRRIKRILDGKKEEYSYFVKQYSQPVLDFVSRMIPHVTDAEELAQDAFIKAFRLLDSFNGDSSFSTWVCRIAYHESLNYLKRKKIYWLDIHEVNLPEDEEANEDLSSSHEERILMLEEALENLPPDEQLLIHLYYYEERPLREIAYIMDKEPNILATRLHRIRKKLLRMIKQREDESNR
jgi:RNA polymerase sigma-70 factor (ECF subfamily)